MTRPLGLIVSACGGVDTRLCVELAAPAAERGWRLAITLTPTAARWLAGTAELDRLRSLTDLPVRSASRLPGEPRPHPDPEVFLFRARLGGIGGETGAGPRRQPGADRPR